MDTAMVMPIAASSAMIVTTAAIRWWVSSVRRRSMLLAPPGSQRSTSRPALMVAWVALASGASSLIRAARRVRAASVGRVGWVSVTLSTLGGTAGVGCGLIVACGQFGAAVDRCGASPADCATLPPLFGADSLITALLAAGYRADCSAGPAAAIVGRRRSQATG